MEITVETKCEPHQIAFFEVGHGNTGKAYVPIKVLSVSSINFNSNGTYTMYNVKNLIDGHVFQLSDNSLVTLDSLLAKNNLSGEE